MTTVYGFDRDHTVDVNPHPTKAAVPLDWIIELRDRPGTEVWAIGNQRLRTEAGIPGVSEARDRLDEKITVETVERPDALEDTGLIPRRDRLRLLEALFPTADSYIVVDDVDLSDMPAWTHYYPWDFYHEFQESFKA